MSFGPFAGGEKFKSNVSYVGQLEASFVGVCLELMSPQHFPRQITAGMDWNSLFQLWAFCTKQWPWDPLASNLKAAVAPCQHGLGLFVDLLGGVFGL